MSDYRLFRDLNNQEKTILIAEFGKFILENQLEAAGVSIEGNKGFMLMNALSLEVKKIFGCESEDVDGFDFWSDVWGDGYCRLYEAYENGDIEIDVSAETIYDYLCQSLDKCIKFSSSYVTKETSSGNRLLTEEEEF